MQRVRWGAFLFVLIAGCWRAEVAPPRVDPQAAAKSALEQYDTNKSSYLDEEELAAAPGWKATLSTSDSNGDARLEATEIAARVNKIVGEEIGMMHLSCIVTWNGEPLPDALVTAIPEPALGPEFKTARGRTGPDGRAGMSAGVPGFPGMQCGIFRIEITKKGDGGEELIPAKYNTQSILGMEVATDVPFERGIKFELKSEEKKK